MVYHPYRMTLLLFVGFLISIQLNKVSGLRSSEIALKQNQKEHRIMLQNQHTVKAPEKELLNTKKSSANVNNVSVLHSSMLSASSKRYRGRDELGSSSL